MYKTKLAGFYLVRYGRNCYGTYTETELSNTVRELQVQRMKR